MLIFTISLDPLAMQTVEYSLCTFGSSSPCRVLRPVLTSVLATLGLGQHFIPALDHLTQHNSGKHVALPWILHQTQDHGMCCGNVLSCPVAVPNMSHLFCDSIMWLNWQAGVDFSHSGFNVAYPKGRGLSKCFQSNLCVWRAVSGGWWPSIWPDTA